MIRSVFIQSLILLSILEMKAEAFVYPFPKLKAHDSVTYSKNILLATTKGFGKSRGSTKKTDEPVIFPPMNDEEIGNWMSHIPVYAVTDTDGNGQAINVGEKTAFYFFMSPIVAQSYKTMIEESTSKSGSLIVTGLFLGKIWFDILHNGNESDDVEYRLVPDPRDLMAARTLVTLDDSEDNSIEGETRLAAACDFASPYNEIPLFCVESMPLKNTKKEVKDFLNKMVSTNCMYFSSQTMFNVLDGQKENDQQYENKESEDDLMSLQQVVDKMQKESTTDFRNVVLLPPAPILTGQLSDEVLSEKLSDPESYIFNTFFLPLFQE